MSYQSELGSYIVSLNVTYNELNEFKRSQKWLILYRSVLIYKEGCFLHVFTSNIFLTIKPYKVLNTFIYKILFNLSESSNTAWFKGLFGQIIRVKVKEMTLIIWPKRPLNRAFVYFSSSNTEKLKSMAFYRY